MLDAVAAAGFDEAALDPRGFRSGSMNEALTRNRGSVGNRLRGPLAAAPRLSPAIAAPPPRRDQHA